MRSFLTDAQLSRQREFREFVARNIAPAAAEWDRAERIPASVIQSLGAAGYLGSILCEHLLDAGHGVEALDSLYYGVPSLFHLAANPRFQFTHADARDEAVMAKALKGVDAVAPLAALVGAPAVSTKARCRP